jgi:LacI family transcriptional regulator
VGQSRTVTSTDVARAAGVSRATVSVVLNGTHGNIRVSEETHRRVRAVAAALGYSPHPVAQALRRQRSRTIAFVPRTIHTTGFGLPITYQLSLHAAHAAIRHGYHVIEVSPETIAADNPDELIDFLLSRRPDGVVFDAPTTAHEVEAVVSHGIPVVQLMRPQTAVATATITVDAARGVNDAVNHLIGLGHRRIVFLGADDPHVANRSRLDHFIAALARHAISIPDECIVLGTDYTFERGCALTHTLLKDPPLPTAIFAANESFAIGALRALHEARLWVPDTISLVSYDDFYAPILYPPITSVAQPLRAVAEEAVALLVATLEGGADDAAPPAHLVLPTQLNVRASTAPPPAESRAASASSAIGTATRHLGTGRGEP